MLVLHGRLLDRLARLLLCAYLGKIADSKANWRKRFGAPFGYARNASRGKDRKLPRLGWIRIVKFCKSAFHFVTFPTTGRCARIMIA